MPLPMVPAPITATEWIAELFSAIENPREYFSALQNSQMLIIYLDLERHRVPMAKVIGGEMTV
ncbi:hypothetical protein D3C87_2053390 [compost metagenome]